MDHHVSEYKNIITDLREEIDNLKGQINHQIVPKHSLNNVSCNCKEDEVEDDKQLLLLKSEIQENF